MRCWLKPPSPPPPAASQPAPKEQWLGLGPVSLHIRSRRYINGTCLEAAQYNSSNQTQREKEKKGRKKNLTTTISFTILMPVSEPFGRAAGFGKSGRPAGFKKSGWLAAGGCFGWLAGWCRPAKVSLRKFLHDRGPLHGPARKPNQEMFHKPVHRNGDAVLTSSICIRISNAHALFSRIL